MKDYLPLIIGIIWIAYTLYNRSQKKKNVKRPNSSERDEKPVSSLLEQILLGKESIEPQPYETSDSFIETIEENIEEVEEEVTAQKSEPFLQTELANFVQEGQPAFFAEDSLAGLEIFEEKEKDKYIDDFDLKKAVVFSEILNAPYIE